MTIFTQEKHDVLAIPSKALRFTPSDKLLTKEQSIKDEAKGAANKVWVKDGNVFRSIAVNVGITNGSLTEITSGLTEGQAVLTEISATDQSDGSDESSDNSNPFMPGPKDKNNKKTDSTSSSAKK